MKQIEEPLADLPEAPPKAAPPLGAGSLSSPEPSTAQEGEVGLAPQDEVIEVIDSDEAERLALDESTSSDPRSVVSAEQMDPTPEMEEHDPLQLTRVEETGLDTNRATQRIERLLDPVDGNGKDDPAKIIIRLLRRALRRLAALEEGVEQFGTRLAALEDGLQRIEIRLPEPEPPSGEEPGPFG